MNAFLLLLGFAAGALLGYICGGIQLVALLMAAAIALRFYAARYDRRPEKIVVMSRIITVWAVAMMMTIGAFDTTMQPASDFTPASGQKYVVEGVVASRRTLTSVEMYTVQLHTINGVRERGDVTLFASAESVWHAGDILRFESELENRTLFRYARRQYMASTVRGGKAEVVGRDGSPSTLFARWRENLRINIERSGLGKEGRALMLALLVADRTAIDREHIALMRNAGVIHVLAVSGMHIGILAAVLLLLTRPFQFLIGRSWRYAVVVAGIWVFVFVTGSAFSTVRAAVMLTLAATAWSLQRHRQAFGAACYAALFILIIWPEAMFDVGLQLSFTSVAALSLFASPLNPIDHRMHPATYKICGLVLSTLIATGVTWIITGYHFGTVALRFLPANMLILPLLPAYMISGIVYILLSTLGIAPEWGARILEWLPEKMYWLLDRIAGESLEIEVGEWPLVLWLAGVVMAAVAIHVNHGRLLNVNNFTQRELNVNRPALAVALLLLLASLTLVI
ncbi:MAG: ComEC/Rec2 family competence protein, partial [Muribaculaceae bacterium]|nr:ComEC/Rec2 family competence protein [Muribaculaceae bacterium]